MSNFRYDTMTKLHDCECHTPPPPPFPSNVMPISLFEEMLYKVAYVSGYVGSKVEFREDLAKALNSTQQIAGLIIKKGSIKDFPDVGLDNAIYIDTDKKEIYFWQDDGYYKIEGGAGSDTDENAPVIPSDGLIYEGGEI